MELPAEVTEAAPAGTASPASTPELSGTTVLDATYDETPILVIDDDPDVRQLLQRHLLAEGFPVLTAASEDVDLAILKSPIVGTFYRATEPGAKPFAEVGQQVRKGQVLCIIEAMKLMNEINAECDGEVVKVYVENGRAVHYGERLFAIRPT